ncbi:conjugative transfer signal peptidase TraF [Paludibaculum fermentans]|uniref:conjugative transfer signal peptidase TraF n=1 Tax=Paludibaculum fermentans TaxID=1473598 RepID=UPI003EB94E43
MWCKIQEATTMTRHGLWHRLRSTNLRIAARIGVVALSICAGSLALLGALGIRINASPSLPLGLYIVTSDLKASLVEFCPAEPYGSLAAARGYRTKGSCPDGATPLMKPVVARSGDRVQVSEQGLSVNGKLLPNTAPRGTDTMGRPMRQWPVGSYRVMPGTVWVASSHNPRSFDSRYFGPIAVSSIRGHLQPLATEP